MLELRHLQTLSALRAHGSLAAAADELHVTASAVSHQLKELENYYGVKLVNRRTRPLTFTPAGNVVLKLADSILPQVIRTKNNLKRLAHGQAGRLRLASECHSCFDWLMPILNQFRREWSDVELDFATGFEPEPHHLLSEGDIDLLITTSDLDLEGICYQPLFTYESRLVLSPTHPLASKESIVPTDLVDQTLIAYPVEAKRLDVIAKFMAPANVNFAKIRTTELTAMLIQLVASERGVAALPDWVAAEYEKKGWVVTRPLISPDLESNKDARSFMGNYNRPGVYCQLFAATREKSQDVAYMQGFAKLLDELVKP
ncbi:LysR family transcriptional regulator [uncultured Psychrobacter sp.]|jgi:LysR family transcriptional regulator, regulator for metE and metH|uniref:LysR family transcriptional regulator n=1 Tax=uncultured Psychrobacter sp. TaxID=259303 RepID=UPI0025932760|nr:LysR family transcriptional regulator [uncultured Psychrobacter sp.]